ncbi:MAG: hypothetical protein TH68_07000 [Candidatus Synechococcus spongiarum 142]|uniref:Uncharacterized protein n=1 Tax=Candidatus Synechococcus spongiarum 142 TaxID=1608213 RepID=A0A6N3X7P7_9SYNE|nr:MAG: hypothetical protein TH68_07000 [Candidatus Synechococcus spongiarum 142]
MTKQGRDKDTENDRMGSVLIFSSVWFWRIGMAMIVQLHVNRPQPLLGFSLSCCAMKVSGFI